MIRGPEDSPIRLSGWALILGASSGFGEATALALAGAGMSIVGVHLDRKATLPNAERIGRQTVTLPLFPTMELADVDRVVAAVTQVLKGRA